MLIQLKRQLQLCAYAIGAGYQQLPVACILSLANVIVTPFSARLSPAVEQAHVYNSGAGGLIVLITAVSS